MRVRSGTILARPVEQVGRWCLAAGLILIFCALVLRVEYVRTVELWVITVGAIIVLMGQVLNAHEFLATSAVAAAVLIVGYDAPSDPPLMKDWVLWLAPAVLGAVAWGRTLEFGFVKIVGIAVPIVLLLTAAVCPRLMSSLSTMHFD